MDHGSVKRELSLFSYEILGLVGRGGAGPHDLLRMARQGRILDWAGESQYYTEPKRLASLGYLEARKEPGRTRERTVYALTERGLDALRSWAETPVRFTPVKSELLVRLLVTDLVGEERAWQGIAPLRDEIAELLERVGQSEERADRLPHRRAYLRLAAGFRRQRLGALGGRLAGARPRGLQQELGDLDRVQRRALDEVVAGEEEHEAVAAGGPVGTDAADEDVLRLRRGARGRGLDEPHARRGGEKLRRAFRLERLLGLDPDRLGVADEDGDAHGRGAHGQAGQVEDLAGLGADLRLLFGLVVLPGPVEPEVVALRRLGAQPLHPLGARARDRLVGGDPHRSQAGGVVQRLQHACERDGRAVRVGDDPRRLERVEGPLPVHLGHDERVAVREPVGARLVDRQGPALDCGGNELARRVRAAGEEDEVELAGGERRGSGLLDREAAVEPSPGRARRGEGAHVPVAALPQEPQGHGPHGAGRADDADPGLLRAHPAPSSKASCSAATARGTSSLRTWQAILIGEVETTSASTPIAASVAKARAATPGWLFMPAPTRLTLPRSSRIDHSTPSSSSASSQARRSSAGALKTISPPRTCRIVSTLTFAAASRSKSGAASICCTR